MSIPRTGFLFVTTAALLAGVSGPPAAAQDVRYVTVSTVELGGSLGRVMSLFSGFGDPIRETVSITPVAMRSEGDDQATIMLAEDGTITFLDHEARTYWTMNVAEMLAGIAGGAMPGVEAPEMDEADRAAAEAYRDSAEAYRDSVHYEVHVSMDRPGRRERVAGYEAEQVFVTVEIEGEAYAEEGDSMVSGTMVVLTEMWLSEEFPGRDAEQAFQRAWAERVMEGFVYPEEDARDMTPVFAHDPRLREGLEQVAEQMAELEGTPLRTVSHFVMVPEGVDFDRDAVLRDADKSLAEDVGGAVVGGAVRGARRRLGGILGRRNNDEPELRQAVVMRVTNEIEDVQLTALPPELFRPPADYTLRESPLEQARRHNN